MNPDDNQSSTGPFTGFRAARQPVVNHAATETTMVRQWLLAGAAFLAISSSANAADPCQQLLINPGHSIGQVRLGMSTNELRKVATVKPQSERSLTLELKDGTQLKAELDGKLKVTRVRLDAERVCVFTAGFERRIDLKAPGAETEAPLPDCGFAAAAHRSVWQCPETGVEFFWESSRSGASVFTPSPMKPFVTAPPPRPTPPKPVVQCESTDGGEKKCVELPPADPCAGNVAPMPELACGFFGRNERLAVHCYLVHWCMGGLDAGGAGRVEVRGEDGSLLGTMGPWHEGRSLRYAFGSRPKVGTKVRIIVDGALAAIPPESALPNPAVSPAEAKAREAAGAPVPVKLRHVVGARSLPAGYVLDLKVPRSAISAENVAPKTSD